MRRTPVELFFRIAYVLMFLIAVELIRGSIVELWWRLTVMPCVESGGAARTRLRF